ncbi:hypothetical protein Moror_5280 [Moniliophthora roreri MCA 2997]|uniref:Shugoshin C-terminal domain-containing protein n=2 Tax=Moniliophthora roreri TaxID=221103 RepID=V2X5Q9_MONRO|nr:hypothetical protein Moror_5280 [Moniliophthora roreri MCA 2997]
MSRRESRNSLDARQNDALFEFENFKKKFLLANKHITKLNSTLSVRIEELNAQISMLYTENLRLRASEIALAAELKREREKSRQILKQTELAAIYLTKHLTSLRQDFNISERPPQSPSPTPPRAVRRPAPQNDISSTSPVAPKLSRAPTVPKIHEDDEPSQSSQGEAEEPPPPSPRRKAKAKARLSASRLPLPSRIASPPPQEVSTSHVALQIDFTSIPLPPAKRKPARRQSGLLIDTRMQTLENQAPASPLAVDRPPSPAFGSPIRRATGLAEQREEAAALRRISGDEVPLEEEIVVPAKKSKSSKSRESRERDPIVDMPAARPTERKKPKARDEGDGLLTDGGVGVGSGVGKKLKLQDVTNSPHNGPVASPIDTAAMSEIEAALAPASSSSRSSSSHLPTPSPPPGERDADLATVGGRERRVRKSVNYTEPKLNTKMRKPDPPEGSAAPTTSRKRSTKARSRGSDPVDDTEDADGGAETEARSSLDKDEPRPPRSSTMGDPVDLPLLPSSSLKRNKSRPCMTLDDEEEGYDDGADADEEYVPAYGAGRVSWVNVGERRKGVRDRRATSGTAGKGRTDDERRHSLAV